jgi:hypothetical protein
MQLRVARLCLDCEELFVGDTCPICASQRFAFLSNWLPVEERRRWRRPAPKSSSGRQGILETARRLFARWTGGDEPEPAFRTLRTRASDRLPKLDFEAVEPDPPKDPQRPPELARDQSSPR